ncbi:hypothetical protein [Flavobacterium sp. MDT1-60]|uniref:hypothetical protein n=1 Tax=Flavobacterium sp. MDT1-60 TaxID=1979344 RepID=UPI001780E522|nr:hypothetical protein [Flavobacterium sp. MDT1-60]QOG04819.1 hypothetical protein IHE43_11765 [Flavobacterium sp. MDT1-60]
MKKKIKKLSVLLLTLLVAFLLAKCAHDEQTGNNGVAQNSDVNAAKKWFAKYESSNENYSLFQNLDYDWDEAKLTTSEDGTKTVIVSINELKSDPRDFWEQRLYIYKTGKEVYRALVYEIYTNKYVEKKNQSLEGGSFTGYISVWDLKTGFIRAARFENNKVVETGTVEVVDYSQRNITNKAPIEAPCIYADFGDGGCGGKSNGGNDTTLNGGVLRDVPVFGPSNGTQGSPVEYYGPRSPVIGGGDTGNYTSPNGGGASTGGGGTSTEATPPSCESFNFLKVAGLWQESAVKNIYFRVILVNEKGLEILHVISYSQPVLFGTPTNVLVGNTNITAGIAANSSAKVLRDTMQEVIDKYGGQRVSELTVDLYFRERLERNYPLAIPGGRVQFNSKTTLSATEYKTNFLYSSDCR